VPMRILWAVISFIAADSINHILRAGRNRRV
jgi:hypothetical protein